LVSAALLSLVSSDDMLMLVVDDVGVVMKDGLMRAAGAVCFVKDVAPR
jgi:hypothetical protein